MIKVYHTLVKGLGEYMNPMGVGSFVRGVVNLLRLVVSISVSKPTLVMVLALGIIIIIVGGDYLFDN